MNGFHGWRIAWALAVTQTVGFGVLFYAYGVLTLPMEAEFGWSRAQTSGAYSVALLLSGLAAVPIGRVVDARGARLPMSVGSTAGAALLLAWSFVETLPGLYLVQAGIGVVMAAVLYDVAFAVLAVWFRRERMRALLVVTLVAGLASTIFVPLASGLVESVGWRAALRVLAAVLATTTVPLHALVLRDHPRRVGQAPDGAPSEAAAGPEADVGAGRAVRSAAFWWLAAAFALDRVAVVAVAAHGVPMLVERGHPPGLVAAAIGSIGLLQLAGRALFAPATRRVPLDRLAALTYAVRALALLLLLAPGVAAVWAFAALFGLANGAATLARAGLVADAFGSRAYGAINGGISTLVAVVQTVAPLAVGASRVAAGGYDPALLALALVALLAAGAVTRAGIATPAPDPIGPPAPDGRPE